MKVSCIEGQRNPYFVRVIFNDNGKTWAFEYCHQSKKDENKQAGYFYFVEPTGEVKRTPPEATRKAMIEMIKVYFKNCGLEQFRFKEFFAGVGV